MKRLACSVLLALCFALPASADLVFDDDDLPKPDETPAAQPATPDPEPDTPPPSQTAGACSQSLEGPAWILALVAAGLLTLGAARVLAERADGGPQVQPA